MGPKPVYLSRIFTACDLYRGAHANGHHPADQIVQNRQHALNPTAMKKILTIPSYLWAVMCLLLIPVTFIKNDALATQLARLPFMKVHPVYSGGAINRSYLSGGLQVTLHDPVFIRGNKGFVQVSFSTIDSLPKIIRESIDFDFDKQPDFAVTIDTKSGTTHLGNKGAKVKSLKVSSRVKNDWVIRVNIEK
jgi:hypothetical protein